jgi:NhaP-type Na+/H+ or K+/H+ antiporter
MKRILTLDFWAALALVTIVPFFTMFGIAILSYLLLQHPW